MGVPFSPTRGCRCTCCHAGVVSYGRLGVVTADMAEETFTGLCFDDESVDSVSPFSSSCTTSPTVTVFFSAFVSRELWTPCVSCPVNRVNCFLSPQFDMILGKLENDGSRKVR